MSHDVAELVVNGDATMVREKCNSHMGAARTYHKRPACDREKPDTRGGCKETDNGTTSRSVLKYDQWASVALGKSTLRISNDHNTS